MMVRSKVPSTSVTSPWGREGPGPLTVRKLCWFSVPCTSFKVGSRHKGDWFTAKRTPTPSGKHTPSLVFLWSQVPWTLSTSEILPAAWSHIPNQNTLFTCYLSPHPGLFHLCIISDITQVFLLLCCLNSFHYLSEVYHDTALPWQANPKFNIQLHYHLHIAFFHFPFLQS